MIKEFISRDQDFSQRVTSSYLRFAVAFPLGALAIVALTFGFNHRDGEFRVTKFEKISFGLSHMDATDIIISLLIGSVLVLLAIWLMGVYYHEREIVVGLKFDDNLKLLTVKTLTRRGHEFHRTHKYSELVLKQKHLSDGMTPPMYNTLTLVKGEYLIGHVYKNHFTWDPVTLSEIEGKLRSSLKCVLD